MKGVLKVSYKEMLISTDGEIRLVFGVDRKDKYLVEKVINEVVTQFISRQNAFTLTLAPYKSQRSVFQNNLMWRLLRKLTEAMYGKNYEYDVWEVYCDCLAATGAKYEDLLALPEAEGNLKEIYRAMRKMGERAVNGRVLNYYRCYVGTSKMDTKEMTAVIELLFDRLAELGVTDEETAYDRKEWDKCKK